MPARLTVGDHELLRHHGYAVRPGTPYPILHQLEAAGLLRSEQVKSAASCGATTAQPRAA